MSTKTVYQTNYEGIYVGETLADESPLEPGVWLIPAGAVEVAPPSFDAETQYAQWNNGAGAWDVMDKPTPPDPEDPTDPEGDIPEVVVIKSPNGTAFKITVDDEGKIASEPQRAGCEIQYAAHRDAG